ETRPARRGGDVCQQSACQRVADTCQSSRSPDSNVRLSPLSGSSKRSPLAMRRGWEGTVLLRVHVLASGSPSEIQVQKSSGREALDQAAVKAVKRWSFVPAKRGDKAEDGWVSVPIDFKLN
ncbi:energy transducer TonB, partial [Pseudomonas aeruginosa]|uniref:energy transducer TonB n=1 Tax=Pseudomonas aeruginosa TaxID=287 RepID=UPI00215615EC